MTSPSRPRVMLIVETSLAYGRDVLRGINQYVLAHQPWSFYLDLRELIIEPPGWIDRWDGDGIISRSTTPELAIKFKKLGIPVVDLTDIHGDLGLPHVWTDHLAVGQFAATHLVERGFSSFGFCGFSDHDWSDRRSHGFQSNLGDKCMSFSAFLSPWSISKSSTWDQQQQSIVAWLKELPKPVGIFACNDLRGQHVLDACRRANLAVPEEVAVIGVDNDELLCELCDPPLSSVIANPQRIGFCAAQLLHQQMQGRPAPGEPVRVGPVGVATRQSTDVLAIDDPLVAMAVQFIRERACDGITVQDVLREVPLSRSVLERRFRRYLSRSPQAEIRNVQLKRVKQLLTETDLALDRIAALTGFEHPEYLSVVFKRETGETPGKFRARN